MPKYDEHLVAFVDGSYFPPNGCKVTTKGNGENETRWRKEMGTLDGGRIGWGFAVVRGEESEVLWADRSTCETDGISEKTTNIFGELTAIQKLMQSCHHLTRVCVSLRGDCTFAGCASIATSDPGSEQLWPLVSSIHRATVSMFERKTH